MSIQDEFLFVLKTYFPHWRCGKEWTVKEVQQFENERTAGRCLHKERTIQVIAELDGLREALIHECCHAVTARSGVCHSSSWQARMEKAAQKAETIGDDALSQAIREDAARYVDMDGFDDENALLPDDVICEFEKGPWDAPDLTFGQLKEIIARDWGIPTPIFELPQNAKRCRQEFNKARREAREARQARERWDAALAAQGSK